MDYGDLGKRIVAYIIDSIIIGAMTAAWIFLMTRLGLGIAAAAISPVISWLYFILMEGGSAHATVGKRVMNLYVADANGNGITYSVAILRLIGKMLSSLIFCIGYLIAFFDEKKQGLHDMIAKTYVLNGNVSRENTPGLMGINGPLAGLVYPISGNGLVIGRDSVSCQVVIPSSQSNVSRIHCYITYNPMSGMYILNDRKSTYGTFLANGTRISYTQPAALKKGDRFYVATPENTFELR